MVASSTYQCLWYSSSHTWYEADLQCAENFSRSHLVRYRGDLFSDHIHCKILIKFSLKINKLYFTFVKQIAVSKVCMYLDSIWVLNQ